MLSNVIFRNLAFRFAVDVVCGLLMSGVAYEAVDAGGFVAWAFAFAYASGIQVGVRWEQYKADALKDADEGEA